MSTPHQGPGQQVAGTDLTNLSAQQQRNLQLVLNMTQEQSQKLERMLNKQPLRVRIHTAIGNAVARVHQVYDQTSQRLSESAQTLATQARQYQQAAVDTYNRASEQVSDLVDRGAVAADLAGQRVREGIDARGRAVAQGVEATRQAVVQGAQNTGQAIAQGARTTGQAVVQGAQNTGQAISQRAQAAGQAVAEGSRQAAAAGHQLAGNVSRWFQDKKANAQTRAEAARASFAAFRMDPTLPQNAGTAQDRLELSQQFSKIMSAPTYEARVAAVDDLLRATESKIGATQQNPQTEAQNAAMRAFSGVQPQTHTTAPAATGQNQNTEQGAQSTVNLNKNQPNKGGPTIG